MVPPRESLMPRATRESPMWRASGTERASRSSLGTTGVSPVRTAARAWSRSGAAGSGEALVEVDPVVRDAERGQGLALGDEFAHPGSVSFAPRSPDYGRTGLIRQRSRRRRGPQGGVPACPAGDRLAGTRARTMTERRAVGLCEGSRTWL